MPEFRLGTEIADRARFWGRVGGIFHTDEMPAYGVTTEEIDDLRKAVTAEEQDAIVFVADKAENAKDALKAVVERARETLKGVPAETRAPNAAGMTRYMRPRPGSARMYPETDIPVTEITPQHIENVRSHLPEMPEQKLKRLVKQYELNEKLSKQVIDSEYGELFETITKESGVSPTTVAAFLTETLRALKRDGFDPDKISDASIRDMFKSVGAGKLTKEAIPDVASWLSRSEDRTVQDAMESFGFKMLSKDELERIIDKTMTANADLITKRGENAFGVIMGIVMKEVRGKAPSETVSQLLRKKLAQKTVA
jgi:glutamyl-tRNA(Gln) amidotransferase subunit E